VIYAQLNVSWVEVGVAPDIKVKSDIAVEIAQKQALNLLLTKTDDPERSKELQQIISEIKRQIGEAN
jgi:hypothetical protein